MDIFEYQRRRKLEKEAPLAARMRPRTLDGFVGQGHIVGGGKLLRRAIQADRISSIILHGPPGSGKTTLAHVIAATTMAEFVELNATTSGVKDVKRAVEEAGYRLGANGRRTIVFIDEIHRFNKAQQDVLLPHVENGTVILVGATTENPYFEVIKALVSRSLVYALHPLEAEDVATLIRRALADEEAGLGKLCIRVSEDAISFLADVSGGDARAALNALELAALSTPPNPEGVVEIGLEAAQECVQRRAIAYDRDGDNHYDTISAFIKSMRGSDPDAALYYLARMLHAGEDPEFIARRILIAASEDIGNADPHALLVADACARAVRQVGLPECRIILAHAVTYLACAPKSNAAYLGLLAAEADVNNIPISEIPAHLRDSNSSAMGGKPAKGARYLYPHDYPGGYVPQRYLPREVAGPYYHPTANGVERRIRDHLEKLRTGGKA